MSEFTSPTDNHDSSSSSPSQHPTTTTSYQEKRTRSFVPMTKDESSLYLPPTGIVPESVDKLFWSDEHQDLRLLTSLSKPYESFPSTNYTQCPEMIRGWIFSKKDPTFFIPNLPYTLTGSTKDLSSDELWSSTFSWMANELSKFRVFYSQEGTLIRIFYYEPHHRWYIATNKKLDAFTSRWSSRFSFGHMILYALESLFRTTSPPSSSSTQEEEPPSSPTKNALQLFLEELDSSKIYFFLLRPNHENRIVCRIPLRHESSQRLLFLGWLSRGQPISQYQFVETIPEEQLSPMLKQLGRPIPFQQSVPFQEIGHWVEQHINPTDFQGLVFLHTENLVSIRIVTNEYKELQLLRGSHPNLFYRYFELRHQPSEVEKLCRLYDKQCSAFDDYEQALFHAAKHLHQLYVQRYIKNQYVTLPKEEYYLLKKCHLWYLEDRLQHRIHTRTVLDLLNKESPLVLFRLAKKFLRTERVQSCDDPQNSHNSHVPKVSTSSSFRRSYADAVSQPRSENP